MNAGLTSERVQEGLRRLIMERRFRPGDRLEPAELAPMLVASTTPVREALNHLAGAGLVESRSGGGFHLPLIDEPGLQDLYRLSGEILQLALRRPRPDRIADVPQPPASMQAADRTDLFLQHLADASDNREHGAMMKRINERLHAVRLGEVDLLADLAEEEKLLQGYACSGTLPALRRALARFHLRRIKVAGALLRLLYRDR
jgi:DNA-binding GntR family transcriptional regulator